MRWKRCLRALEASRISSHCILASAMPCSRVGWRGQQGEQGTHALPPPWALCKLPLAQYERWSHVGKGAVP